MLQAETLIAQGNAFLACGKQLQAQDCFRQARNCLVAAEAEISSVSFAGVAVKKIVRQYKISDFVSASELSAVTNKLECICLLATGNESQNQEYDKFVARLVDSLKHSSQNAEIAKQLDLKIIATAKFTGDVSALNPFFRSAEVLVIPIPEEFDFYHSGPLPEKHNMNLKWGQHAGPNWIFFETLIRCKGYNTVFFLECDCFFGENWLKRLTQFIDNAGGFWVSGAVYSGIFFRDLQPTIFNHINGGTGLYATGNKQFQLFMLFSQQVFQHYVSCKPNLPYDCFLHCLLDDFYHFDLNHRFIWQFIRQQYVTTKLIQNYSPPHDRLTDATSIAKRSNYAVLHKKTIEPPPVPVFVHLPKCGGSYFYIHYFVPNLLRAYVQNGYDGIPASYQLTDNQGYEVLKVITSIKDHSAQELDLQSVFMPIDLFKQKIEQGKVGPIVGCCLTSNSSMQTMPELLQSWCPGNLEFILLLRDPLRREESLFYYLRDLGSWERTYDSSFKEMTFEQYLSSDRLSPDWIVRRLVDKLNDSSSLTEVDFEKAVAFVDNCKVVGFQHKYEQFVAAVNKRYGFIHNPTHCEIPKGSGNQNTVSKKLPVTDAMVKTICRRSPVDARLYHYCLNSFDST